MMKRFEIPFCIAFRMDDGCVCVCVQCLLTIYFLYYLSYFRVVSNTKALSSMIVFTKKNTTCEIWFKLLCLKYSSSSLVVVLW